LRKTDDSYEVYYPVEFEERDASSRSFGEVIRNSINNNIYTLNILNLGVNLLKEYIKGGRGSRVYPNYDNFTEDDLDIIKFVLEEVIKSAGGRPVYLFTIPEESDIEFARQNGYQFRLVKELTELAGQWENMEYMDLLTHFLEYAAEYGVESREFTLGCNRHWGELGSEVAAQAVYDFVFSRSE
jgi:hypothetical protein